MEMGIDVGGGCCHRFEEKRPRLVEDVVSIPKDVILAYESLSEAGAEAVGEGVSGLIVGKDVGGGRVEQWGSFEKDDVVGW